MICGCALPAIDSIRTQTTVAISSLIKTFLINSPPYICATAIRDMMRSESMRSPHLLWIGTWTPAHVQHLQLALSSLPSGTFDAKNTDPVYDTLQKIGHLLAAGATEIMKQRHAAHVILERVERQFKHRTRNPHPARSRTFHANPSHAPLLHNHKPTAQDNRYSRALEGLLKPTRPQTQSEKEHD